MIVTSQSQILPLLIFSFAMDKFSKIDSIIES